MKPALRFLILFVFSIFFNPAVQNGLAEPLPLKRVVELAIRHSTVTGATAADEQRAFASYHEARNQYLPTLVVGSGLGATWGYPLSLEGSAPSIVNVTAQSAVLNPSVRDFVRAAGRSGLLPACRQRMPAAQSAKMPCPAMQNLTNGQDW